jgi:hypothetical protein
MMMGFQRVTTGAHRIPRNNFGIAIYLNQVQGIANEQIFLNSLQR